MEVKLTEVNYPSFVCVELPDLTQKLVCLVFNQEFPLKFIRERNSRIWLVRKWGCICIHVLVKFNFE